VGGWRAVVEGTCGACGHRFVQDLPNGHALVYPTTLDLTTGDVVDPAGAVWFSSQLRAAWARPNGDPVAVERRGEAQNASAILANCLDPVYGHGLLKLLGVQRELERAESAAVVALVPAALAPIVPEAVDETWIVHGPVPRLRHWLLGLEERIASELDRFETCRLAALSPHPHPTTFDLESFVGHIDPKASGSPSVLLSLRPDRRWGRDQEQQMANVAELVARLSAALPTVGVAAVGAAQPGDLPASVDDRRVAHPTEEDERDWIARMRAADLVVGVHGSNLVLASGLARAVVELVPAERYSNYLQATLVTERDPILALDRHRALYGDAELADITGARVAEVSLSLLTGSERVELLMTGPAAGVGDGEVPLVRATPASPVSAPEPQASASPVSRAAQAAKARGGDLRNRVRGWRRQRALRYSGPLPVVLTDARGISFEMESSDEVTTFRRHHGHFESDELAFVARAVTAGATVIDVGANVGAFTAVLSRAVGERGHVHAFEPFAAARRRLARTIELNRLTNVIVDGRAVADEVGQAQLAEYGPGFESWSTLVPREIELDSGVLTARAVSEVATTTLDAYCHAAEIEAVALLKVDVEGAELRVLHGAARLLERNAIDIAIVEVADTTLGPAGASAADVTDLLEQHGLRPYVLASSGRLEPFRVTGPQLSLVNVIALSPSARERLA
jgi:FkbM family methyltransferase